LTGAKVPARAEPLFKRALVIRQNALGPDHPDLAISLTNRFRAAGQPHTARADFRTKGGGASRMRCSTSGPRGESRRLYEIDRIGDGDSAVRRWEPEVEDLIDDAGDDLVIFELGAGVCC
jgi:hypothetical protein